MTFRMESKKQKVRKILLQYPEARDDDYVLLIKYNNIYKEEFVSDTITRARRQLQEHDPHLRGKKWNARHGIIPNQMLLELGYKVNKS